MERHEPTHPLTHSLTRVCPHPHLPHAITKVIIPASGIAAVCAELEACIARGPGAPASGASTTEEDQHRVTTIYTKKLKTEGKIVFIDLMEKSWGRYLKISPFLPIFVYVLRKS